MHSMAPELLYHYTTAEGLLGIVSSKSLWASDAEFLSDARELQYGRQELRDKLLEKADAIDRKAEPWKEHEYRAMVIERAAHFMDGQRRANSGNSLPTVFVTCFCEDGDLLSQWRGYANPGGFSLGFRSSSMTEITPEDSNSEPDPYGWKPPLELDPSGPVQVEYGRRAIDKMLAAVVPQVPPNIDDGPAAPFGEQIAADLLIPALASVKDPAFQEEREWRLIAKGRFQHGSFRTSPVGFVPYVHLAFPPSAVAEVIVGPGRESEPRIAAVERLLLRHGMREVKVSESKAPFRG